MQILPTQRHQASSTLFSAFGQDNNDTPSFMDELLRQKEAVTRVANNEAASVQDALTDMGETNAPLVTAPYTANTSNGVTYELDEVSFTQQELQDLHHDMQAAGAPAESLEELRVLAEQPNGATLSQVVAAVQQIPQAPNLTEDETGSVGNLLNTIDPSGALAENDWKEECLALLPRWQIENVQKQTIFDTVSNARSRADLLGRLPTVCSGAVLGQLTEILASAE